MEIDGGCVQMYVGSAVDIAVDTSSHVCTSTQPELYALKLQEDPRGEDPRPVVRQRIMNPCIIPMPGAAKFVSNSFTYVAHMYAYADIIHSQEHNWHYYNSAAYNRELH